MVSYEIILEKLCGIKDLTDIVFEYLTPENGDRNFRRYCDIGYFDKIVLLLVSNRKFISGNYFANTMALRIPMGFLYLCKNNYEGIINYLIENWEREYHFDWDKGLLGACMGGHKNIINLMIRKGAYQWNSGLYGACLGGHMDIVKLMIERGAKDWRKALHGACTGGNIDIVKLIISYNKKNNWNAGLRWACLSRNEKIIELMLENKADVLTEQLQYAFYTNDTKFICKILYAYRELKNSYGSLWFDIEYTNINAINLITEHGDVEWVL